MMMTYIRPAKSEDLTDMITFLGQADVSTKGIQEQVDHFILLEDDHGSLLGTLGIERLNEDGLLRTLVISPKVDQTQILDMFQQILKLARDKEMKCLYLVTNKMVSIEFFSLLGFRKKAIDSIPEHILHAEHVKDSMEMGETIIMEFKI